MISNQIRESSEIPDEVKDLVEEKRALLIEQLSEADETLCDKFLNEEPISDLDIAHALRRATTSLKFVPVFMGSAIKNTAVQPLLDGVCAYLPDPSEVPNQATDAALPLDAPPVPLVPTSDAALVGLAFKLEEGRFGQLTYMRVYQGTLKKGSMIINARTGKRVKVPRLVRMHSDEMEDVDEIVAGEICAMFGVECSSGDTFTDGKSTYTMVSRWPRIGLTIDIHVCPRACHFPLYPTRRSRNTQLFQSS